jgi:polyhydroxyalkanoate synthesis regulator phasin
MKLPDLHEDRQCAEKQWRAARTLIYSQEQQLSHSRKRIQELEKELALIDKTEIDALYSTIERLTNELEVR